MEKEKTIAMLRHYIALIEAGDVEPDIILIHNGQRINDWRTENGCSTWAGMSHDKKISMLSTQLEIARQFKAASIVHG